MLFSFIHLDDQKQCIQTAALCWQVRHTLDAEASMKETNNVLHLLTKLQEGVNDFRFLFSRSATKFLKLLPRSTTLNTVQFVQGVWG